MINAAAAALPGGSITAVTVLTSFSDSDFAQLGYEKDISKTAKIWGSQAIKAGATSLVCSPFEAKEMKELAPSAVIITPGVRMLGENLNDQSRVMTPKEALDNGADYVVIGRSITSQSDKCAGAMQNKINEILESISN
jgi:orotidine-5'-phosphate decarboxylase